MLDYLTEIKYDSCQKMTKNEKAHLSRILGKCSRRHSSYFEAVCTYMSRSAQNTHLAKYLE